MSSQTVTAEPKRTRRPRLNLEMGAKFEAISSIGRERLIFEITDKMEDGRMVAINKRTHKQYITYVVFVDLSRVRLNLTRHSTRVVQFDDYYFARITASEPLPEAEEAKPTRKRARAA